ncbi:helix-turn-helix transcriptional regulator [Winogradskya humida]|uniref:helix-turn-helix transcriptional regulator n=1 Tax=Winogradskya humida TaxID=113566 RepID=UPI0023B26563
MGRDEEMAGMAAQLPVNGPVFLTVEGEPGIGKSRLLGAFAQLAADRGRTVLLGRSTQFERSLPFGVWLDATDDNNRLAGLHRLFTNGIEDVSASALERHRLHRAVRAALAEAASPDGLLLLFDDAHWADEASVEVFDYLIRHAPPGPVLIGMAARTGRFPPRLIRSLTEADAPVHQVSLGPLSVVEVDAWLTGDASPGRRRRLHAASGGNPLFLGMLAALPDVPEPDALTPAPFGPPASSAGPGMPGRGVLTAALDRLIADELRGLAEMPQRIAHAAAVAGDATDPALVAAIAELPDSTTEAALDVLAEAAVLAADERGLSFRHPLIRAAAYHAAGPGWRTGAHRRAAEHLRTRDAAPARRAAHLEHAVRAGDLDGAQLLTVAGKQALATAPATAIRWLGAALRALPFRPEFAATRDDLRLALCEALAVSGRTEQSRTLLHELLSTAGPGRRTAVVVLLADAERTLGNLSEAGAILIAELPRAGAAGRAELLLELASTELHDGRLAACAAHATEALRVCDPPARPGIPAVAVTLLAVCALYRCDFVLGHRLLDRAAHLVDALSDPQLSDDLAVVVPLAWGEFLLDRHTTAIRRLDRGLRVARRFGRHHAIPMNYAIRAAIRIRLGEVGQAIADATDATEIAQYVGGAETRAFLRGVRARPLLWRDGPQAVTAAVAEALSGPPLRALWWRTMLDHGLAEILLSIGEAEQCRQLLRSRVPADPSGLGPNVISTYAMRAQAEAICGDLAAAAEWYERAATLSRAGAPPAQSGCVARAGAVLATARGEHAAAVGHATQAVERFRVAAIPIGEAFAQLVLAQARTGGGDLRGAKLALGAARELFDACGAPWLASMVSREQRRAGAQTIRSGAGQLSAREREIAELVAQGMTNQQVADQLFLSPRTVETHLSRVFQKLKVATRTALARRFTEPAG